MEVRARPKGISVLRTMLHPKFTIIIIILPLNDQVDQVDLINSNSLD